VHESTGECPDSFVDEKTEIQALYRTQPVIPLGPKKPRAWTNEYTRHGTKTLIASLNVASGEVFGHVTDRLTSKDFLRALYIVALILLLNG
jgi:putative transposase